MENPQKENGYTPIANEILEALCSIRINGEARQCFDVIFRKTYGFNKKSDCISLSQFALLTKMPKVSVCRGLLKLANMNLIINKNVNGMSNSYAVNKDFSTWKPLTKKLPINKNVNYHLPKRKSSLTKKRNTKETITKETITKEKNIVSNETTVSCETGTTAVKKKTGKPDENITLLIVALKSAIGIVAFVDSRIERNMARHCLSLIRKIGKDEFKRRLEGLLSDNFHAKNCNKIRYVYNNIKGWKEPEVESRVVSI